MGIRPASTKIELPMDVQLGLREPSEVQDKKLSTEEMNEQLKSLAVKSPPKLKEVSTTNLSKVSLTTSVVQLHNKLKMVPSPSTSKDEYFSEDESQSRSEASIPMAHREYEKILRQLEAECRTHIKCEQQMKLHIECLQEKIDTLTAECNENKRKNDIFEQAKNGLMEEMKKTKAELEKAKQNCKVRDVKIQKLESERE